MKRTLLQVKKRQQNFKQLKVKASKTGEEGLNKIKEGLPAWMTRILYFRPHYIYAF